MKPNLITNWQWFWYNSLFFAEHVLGHKRMLNIFGRSKLKLENNIINHAGRADNWLTCDVLEADNNISLKEFKKICHQPLVFRGAANEWDSTKKWSFDFFKKEYGDTEILLNDNVGLVDHDNPQEFNTLKLADYIDALRGGSLSYLKFQRSIFDDHPSLKGDLNLSWLRNLRLAGSYREEAYMFMGGKGTVTPLHVGVSCNLFVQVLGQRKWTLYPAEDRIFLDARTERTFYYYSKANPDKENDPAFPIFRYARKHVVTLNPGDVLWVPPFVWHHVVNPTPSIGVSFRYTNFPAALKASKMLTSLLFMATRPNPLTHFLATTFKKQAYIFTRKTRK